MSTKILGDVFLCLRPRLKHELMVNAHILNLAEWREPRFSIFIFLISQI